MIGGLRPYPKMRPSGLAWLGDVPAHWDIQRAKRLLKPTEIPVRAEDEIVTCFRDGQVTLRRNRRARGFMIALLEQGYQGVRAGQLVVHSMDAFAGAIGVSDSDGKCTPEYIVCDPRGADAVPSYYSWVLRQAARTGFIVASCPAVRERAPRLRYPDMAELFVPVPSPDEQRLIVRFLDWHGHQTAKLIRAKKKIVALLNEQKQAIIHRAVTRGVDPNVRLKPSGIPWLGDVPEGWVIQSLGSMIKRRSARNRTDLPLLSVVRERGVILRSSMSDEENHNFVPDDLSNYKVAMRGDLVINKMKAWQGSLGIAPCDGIVSPAYFVYQLDIEDIAFGQMLLRSKPYVACFARVSDGVRIGQWDLSIDGMKRIPVLRPSRDEQIAIVEFVDRSTLELEKIKEFTLHEIALIQEFRTRLIADVVTGKLDVRAAAASLPEPDELEATDELVEDDDLDEAVDDAENEEVAA